MRAAPPVDAVLDVAATERWLIALLHALAGAMLAHWALQLSEAGLPFWVHVLAVVAAGLAVAVPGAWLARRALPRDAGRLAWDGACWRLQPRGVLLAAVVVALSTERWMLLRLLPGAGVPLWRVASARAAGPHWHGLRVALTAHAAQPEDPSAHAG